MYDHIRWHAGSRRIRLDRVPVDTPRALLDRYLVKQQSKSGRRRTHLEIYSDMYYKTRFHAQVSKEVADTTPPIESLKDSKARKLAIYKKWRANSWASETNEVKSAVQVAYHQENYQSGDASESKGNGTEDTGSAAEQAVVDEEVKLLQTRQS